MPIAKSLTCALLLGALTSCGSDNGTSGAIDDWAASRSAIRAKVCKCLPDEETDCGAPFERKLVCWTNVLHKHESSVSSRLGCYTKEQDRAAKCLAKSCDTRDKVDDCYGADDDEVCGKLPENVLAEMSECASKFICDDGTEIAVHAACDGTSDCPHGEDELDCDQARADAGMLP